MNAADTLAATEMLETAASGDLTRWSDRELDWLCDQMANQGLLLNRDATEALAANGGELCTRLLAAAGALNDERLARRTR
jgi:hypothetical protein